MRRHAAAGAAAAGAATAGAAAAPAVAGAATAGAAGAAAAPAVAGAAAPAAAATATGAAAAAAPLRVAAGLAFLEPDEAALFEIQHSRIPGAGLGAYSRVEWAEGALMGFYKGESLTQAQFLERALLWLVATSGLAAEGLPLFTVPPRRLPRRRVDGLRVLRAQGLEHRRRRPDEEQLCA